MADWKKLSDSEEAFKSDSNTFFEADCNVPTANGGTAYNKYGLTTYIEYDADRTTPTQTYIRFRGTHEGGDSYAADSCLVFYNPNNNPNNGTRKLYTIKTRGGKWSDIDGHAIKITKDYNDTTFYIQDYWICNNGAGKTAAVWNEDIEEAYDYFNGSRAKYTQQGLGSEHYSIMASETVVTDVKAGTISITDHGDNTFTISGTKGANGTNNTASGPTLKWGYTDSYATTVSNNTKVTLTIATPANATRRVYAKSITGAVYGPDKAATTYRDVKQYVAPGKPGAASMTYPTKRVTVKDNWEFRWGEATATNTSSPVRGYRIYVYKNGAAITGLAHSPSGSLLSKGTGTSSYIDRENTLNEILINPTELGFKAKDEVYIKVFAYTKNGAGTKLLGSAVESPKYTVQNAGIVHAKVNGSFKEGQVYVRVNNAWKEAETVNVRVNGAWKESQ